MREKGVPIEETGAFQNLSDPLRITSPLLEYADHVVMRMRDATINSAKEASSRINYTDRPGDDADAIAGNYRVGIPSCNPKSPVDILNAAWRVLFERQVNVDEISDRMKNTELMINLCLKSLEIYEYNRLSME